MRQLSGGFTNAFTGVQLFVIHTCGLTTVCYNGVMLKDGEINWVETLAQIADDKHYSALGAYIRKFEEQPFPSQVYTEKVVEIKVPEGVDYSRLSGKTFTITRMPEATCDGCQ